MVELGVLESDERLFFQGSVGLAEDGNCDIMFVLDVRRYREVSGTPIDLNMSYQGFFLHICSFSPSLYILSIELYLISLPSNAFIYLVWPVLGPRESPQDEGTRPRHRLRTFPTARHERESDDF